jgi:azurin
VLAPTSVTNSNGGVGISNGTGTQTLSVASGDITVRNQGAAQAYINSSGVQDITTRALTVALSSNSASGASASVESTGNQTINLNGDGVSVGTATLTVNNTSSASGSTAKVRAGGNQVINMDYDAAGQVKVGDTGALGRSEISTAGDQTIVAGSLLLQGGAGSTAQAALDAGATKTSTVSTLYGAVQLLGGSDGPSSIDPAVLSIVSNGSVLLQAGSNATSWAEILAGIFNLAATTGDLSLINSTTSSATATIASTTFNFYGPGAIYLTGGTITASGTGSVTVPGFCNNCATNLIGLFNINAYVPPPIDYVDIVTQDVVSLSVLAEALLGFYISEDGTLVPTSRRLGQCY